MTTTTLLRNWWAPACAGPFARVVLHGDGVVTVRSTIVDALKALDACLVKHDYRTRQADTGGYNCRKITGGTGYSLHAYGTAVDINWQSNPYGRTLITDMPPEMVADIKAIRTNSGQQVWRWGGDYAGNKDAMHFEVVCHPADLLTGIRRTTPPKEDTLSAAEVNEIKAHVDAAHAATRKWIKEEFYRNTTTIVREVRAAGGADVDEDAVTAAVLAGQGAAFTEAVKQALREGTG